MKSLLNNIQVGIHEKFVKIYRLVYMKSLLNNIQVGIYEKFVK